MTKVKHEFKTEVKEILHLIIHTLYTHKEVFLRELLSNASDALNKVHFHSLTNSNLYDKDQPLEITIHIDEKEKTLTIEDTGIGMTKDELVTQIGTIAHSGTKKFLKDLAENKDKPSDLIGQFGVGFYSVFMVADKVTIESKSYLPEGEAVLWESDGTGTYSLDESPRRKRGTSIKLHLKEGEDAFLQKEHIKALVNQYSNFLAFPVSLEEEKINQPEALWRKNRKDIKDDEYKEFYKELTHDFMDPIHWEHIQSEAPVQFDSILYFPERPPIETPGMASEHGLKLYAKRVFIQDDCKPLIPRFLRFVKGLVDSEDIPLNVSRETIQDDANITKINKILTKKVLDALARISENDPEMYQTLWEKYGNFLKEGIYDELSLRKKLTPLLRFRSSKQAEAPTVTLADYVERMVENQKAIYYLLGESMASLKESPHLDLFRKHDIEVLLLTEPMDDLVLSHLGEYDDKKLINVESGELDLPEKIAKEVEVSEVEGDMKSLSERIQDLLKDKINKVKFSKALTTSPCRFYNEHGGMSHSVKKIMSQMQGLENMPFKRDLELNPDHPYIKDLATKTMNADFKDHALLLYHLAGLFEGQAENPQELAKLILPHLS
ncbi:MAG: molecular chaperone HtpG [Acidobacteria bacterium]|nr:MAG: molecular chaperone HtpG [Acidobacteriota bacterium]